MRATFGQDVRPRLTLALDQIQHVGVGDVGDADAGAGEASQEGGVGDGDHLRLQRAPGADGSAVDLALPLERASLAAVMRSSSQWTRQ